MKYLLTIFLTLFTFTTYSKNIKFFNGYILQESDLEPGGPSGKNYKIIDVKTKEVVEEFDANRGFIKKTFFSFDNKEIVAVIINESDGGSGAWYEYDTLIYASDTHIRIEEFDNLIEIDIDIEGSHINSLKVIEKIPTKNSIGDEITVNKFYSLIRTNKSKYPYLIEGEMKIKYLDLLEMHVWDYLGSDNYRLNLLKEIGEKKFKEFREISTFGSIGTLLKNRFILLEAAQKIHWENFSMIIVDGFTGEEVAIWYDNKFNGEIIDTKPFEKKFNKVFPFKVRVPFQSDTYNCMIFDSDGSNLSIKPIKSCLP